MARTAYRADIDGLRALAIAPVVLFHSGWSAIAGGFTGVDIFFVVSGFLITGILFRELVENGRIDIVGFYARRVARILPSLILVVCATLVAGALLLSPALFEIQSLTKSAFASLSFSANIYFFGITNSYFAENGHALPLLHTWSLAVEEQYYVVWPLVMIFSGCVGGKLGNRRACCLVAVLAITAISMAVCAWLTPTNVSAAFFLPVTRGWELGLGSALALAKRRPQYLEAMGSGLVGVMLIVIGFLVVREGNGFPFPMALLPTLGTTLLIWAGQGQGTNPVSRLLALPPLVSVGRVSYAWYLWHWPLLSFAYVLTLGQASLALELALAAISLGLSYLTVSLVENPIRFGLTKRVPAQIVVLSGIVASMVVMSLAGGIYAGARFGLLPGDTRIAAAFSDRPVRQSTCLLLYFPAKAEIPQTCLYAQDKPTLLLWGDSYAAQWAPALEVWQRNHAGWGVEQVTLAACPPLMGLMPTDPNGAAGAPYEACGRINNAMSARLEMIARPTIAVLGGDWLARAGTEQPGKTLQYFDAAAHDPATSIQLFEQGLDHTLGLLERHGIPAILVLQSPVPGTPGFTPAACVQRLGAQNCYITQSEFEQKAAAVNSAIYRVARRHRDAKILDPVVILCRTGRCDAMIDGRIAYFDDHHVAASLSASQRAAAHWQPLLDWAARRALP